MSPTPSETMKLWLDRWFWWLTGIGVLLNLSGIHLTVMEPDAALYATVARNMAESGNFQDLIARGTDWLDKPHFPFWVTAVSFRLFGVNSIAYKLPGLLFWAIGVLYTYRYARHLYSQTAARLAVLFLLTAEHLIISNVDVRAEPYLVGMIIAALCHYVRAREARLSIHLVWGSLFAALAVMTKGPFVLLPIVGALAADAFVRRRPLELLSLRWWVALALLLVFISPELVALYRQFDLHPEKRVFGQTGVSGVRFFFWDSQFGRFLNTGPIRGSGDPFFFTHTLLWAFAPWSLWLLASIGSRVARRLRGGTEGGARAEVYSLGAAGLTFLVFSLSRFQLPHYLNILFPFFAVLTAAWVAEISSPRVERAAAWAQVAVSIIFWATAAFLVLYDRLGSTSLQLLFLGGLAAATLLVFRTRSLPDAVGRAFCAAVAMNSLLTVFLLPELLRYQGGSEAAAFLNEMPPRPTGIHATNSYSFEFYADAAVERWDLETLKTMAQRGPLYVYLPEAALPELEAAGVEVRPLRRFDSFRITRLTSGFLNPATREQALERFVLAEAAGPGSSPR